MESITNLSSKKVVIHHRSEAMVDYYADMIPYNEGKNLLFATYEDLVELNTALFWFTDSSVSEDMSDFIMKVEGNEVKLLDSNRKVVHNNFKLTIIN